MTASFSAMRDMMVDTQLRPNGITDYRILSAMARVPREIFVPASERFQAYRDEDLPIGLYNDVPRHLMEPMQFAKLLQLAEIKSDDLVLVVGCLSGYSCAVVCALANAVVGIDNAPDLIDRGGELMGDLENHTVAMFNADLTAGYADQGPYDVIVLEGSVETVPQNLFDQLADNGRLVAIIQKGPIGQAVIFQKDGGRISQYPQFDAAAKPLPGFEAEERFVF